MVPDRAGWRVGCIVCRPIGRRRRPCGHHLPSRSLQGCRRGLCRVPDIIAARTAAQRCYRTGQPVVLLFLCAYISNRPGALHLSLAYLGMVLWFRGCGGLLTRLVGFTRRDFAKLFWPRLLLPSRHTFTHHAQDSRLWFDRASTYVMRSDRCVREA